MTSYKPYSITLTGGQKRTLANAYKKRSPLTLRLKNSQLSGDFPLFKHKHKLIELKRRHQLEGEHRNIKITNVGSK